MVGAAFFQAFPAFETAVAKTPWYSSVFSNPNHYAIAPEKTTFKQVGEEVS
jgi:hypothetical protein